MHSESAYCHRLIRVDIRHFRPTEGAFVYAARQLGQVSGERQGLVPSRVRRHAVRDFPSCSGNRRADDAGHSLHARGKLPQRGDMASHAA
jgi:hypothetical protein